MTISAFLFDCDGTLFPHVEKAHEYTAINTLKSALLKNNLPFDRTNTEKLWTNGLGRGILAFFQSCIDSHQKIHADGIENQISAHELEDKYEEGYIALVDRVNNGIATEGESYFFELRDGVIETIRDAQKLGIPVAVISNATQTVLEKTLSTFPEIAIISTLIAGSDTIENAGYGIKPLGGSYQYAANLLGVDLQHSIGYEDTGSGLASLHDAGVGHIIFCLNQPTMCTDFAQLTQHIDINTVVDLGTNITDIDVVTSCFENHTNQSAQNATFFIPNHLDQLKFNKV